MELKDFEFVEPKSVAPGIPQGQQLNPVDKMAQLVIPRMVDKINYLTARVDQLTRAVEFLLGVQGADHCAQVEVNKAHLSQIEDIAQRIEALEKKEPTIQDVRKAMDTKVKKKTSKKKVDYASIADYDPDKDMWKPKKIAGMEMVGTLVDCVSAMGKDQADDIYAAEVVDFVYKLSDEQKEFIKSIS